MILIDDTVYSLIEKLSRNFHKFITNFLYCLEPWYIITTKIKICQYVIFFKPQKFDTTKYKCFTVTSNFQNPNIHHPKTIALGLQQEKILGISACSVRASVYTESDKVATWIDDALAIVAQKLEHCAQTFPEFQADKIASLHTCSLFTCARLESGALYWW